LKVIDSSGWIEYFADGPRAKAYAAHLSDLTQIITPVIVVYEVYRSLKRQRGEEEALDAVAQLAETQLVAVSSSLALNAANLSLAYGLAMADALIYAAALSNDAELVTSDADFASLPGVTYIAKSGPEPEAGPPAPPAP
jgi:predicted nucleic acid-binding protein